jgi:hypothetical protein
MIALRQRLHPAATRLCIEDTKFQSHRLGTLMTESESALTQLEQSILAKAFRGELVPQDPRDEPVSELLSRIRTTREAYAIRVEAK